MLFPHVTTCSQCSLMLFGVMGSSYQHRLHSCLVHQSINLSTPVFIAVFILTRQPHSFDHLLHQSLCAWFVLCQLFPKHSRSFCNITCNVAVCVAMRKAVIGRCLSTVRPVFPVLILQLSKQLSKQQYRTRTKRFPFRLRRTSRKLLVNCVPKWESAEKWHFHSLELYMKGQRALGHLMKRASSMIRHITEGMAIVLLSMADLLPISDLLQTSTVIRPDFKINPAAESTARKLLRLRKATRIAGVGVASAR